VGIDRFGASGPGKEVARRLGISPDAVADAVSALLDDPEPVVRRNAALALVRFGDPRCRSELVSMLRPYGVVAPSAGVAMTALSQGTPVKRESLLVRYRAPDSSTAEVRSPIPGRIERAGVKEGERFEAGAELFRVAPDAEQVRDALLGLYYFGTAEDLAEVERYERGVEGLPEDVKRQASLAAQAIKGRKS
jgi:multidrug efflux pump subunit AcrA (membrane-fusion protein)